MWRYALAAQWERISEVEAFVGSTGVVGNDTGSRVVAARVVRDLIRLAFLLERRYAPYRSGSGALRAPRAARATSGPSSRGCCRPTTGRSARGTSSTRTASSRGSTTTSGSPSRSSTEPSSFHDRPYKVIHGDRFAAAIRATIDHPAVLALPPKLGTIDQVTDRGDILGSPQRCRALAGLWV